MDPDSVFEDPARSLQKGVLDTVSFYAPRRSLTDQNVPYLIPTKPLEPKRLSKP